MFCETKRKVKSWAVFNFAAIFTVRCYHMWRSCLWLVDSDSKWLPPQLYQMRSYWNPTLLPYDLLVTICCNFCRISFWTRSGTVWRRSATFCYVYVCDFPSGNRALDGGELKTLPFWKKKMTPLPRKGANNIKLPAPFLFRMWSRPSCPCREACSWTSTNCSYLMSVKTAL